MQHYVLNDPSLRPYADRVVFAAVDTDRKDNAQFLQRYPVAIWPTFFVIHPDTERVVAYWAGSASARELRSLLDDAIALLDASAAPDDPRRRLANASAALAAGEFNQARSGYEQLLATTPPDWARRSDALAGLLWTLYRAQDFTACAHTGLTHIGEIRGAAVPADFGYLLMECADHTKDSALQARARAAALQRLQALVDAPPPEASVDDRADAMATLADALASVGQQDAARALHERRLALMQQAAAAAASPQMASTYDYARAQAYLALGRGEEAVKMLEQREQQLADSYEPAARLADVLHAMRRHDEALAAIDRAIPRAYGPRKLKYMETRAAILSALGRNEARVETLRRVVAGYEALATGQRNEKKLEAARKQLREAEMVAVE